MVWGCINARGVACRSKKDGKLSGEHYIETLENSLIPTTHMLAMPDGWIFQQDNATCRTSRLVKGWFEEEEIPLMEWPAHSLDLNPVENLQDQLKTAVQERDSTIVKELWSAVKAAWLAFPFDKLTNLMNSMPRRCKGVIKARGGATKY